MQLLENFDEIESASDAELERLLQAAQKRNKRGYFDKRIARIEAEIERRFSLRCENCIYFDGR